MGIWEESNPPSMCLQQLHYMEGMWVFIPNMYFYNVQHPPQQVNIQSQPPQSPPHSQQTLHPEKNSEQRSSNSSKPQEKLILTRDDLLAAGYESKIKVWTQEEDELLKYFRDKCDLDWDDIAKHIPNRTGRMCYNRHKRLGLSDKIPWKPKHDAQLIRLVEEHGEDWKIISTHLTKWSHLQIKSRYLNHLRPGLSRDEWTVEEDLLLIECFNEHGREWGEAQKRLPSRSLNQIQYRYQGRLLKLNQQKLKGLREKQAEE